MTTTTNRSMKYLLFDTEEAVQERPIVTTPHIMGIDWAELREATWDRTSITQDMRGMNEQRLLQEIRNEVSRTVDSYRGAFGRGFTAPTSVLRAAISSRLQSFVDIGGIRNYQVSSEERYGEYTSEIGMRITLEPIMSVERINMEVRLTP